MDWAGYTSAFYSMLKTQYCILSYLIVSSLKPQTILTCWQHTLQLITHSTITCCMECRPPKCDTDHPGEPHNQFDWVLLIFSIYSILRSSVSPEYLQPTSSMGLKKQSDWLAGGKKFDEIHTYCDKQAEREREREMGWFCNRAVPYKQLQQSEVSAYVSACGYTVRALTE